MLSIIAIVVAGFSLTCIVITVYRNLPSEPTIVLKSDHDKPTTQELAIVDNELNIIL
jgi:hypothetical protein